MVINLLNLVMKWAKSKLCVDDEYEHGNDAARKTMKCWENYCLIQSFRLKIQKHCFPLPPATIYQTAIVQFYLF
jgi:hypothetical protein